MALIPLPVLDRLPVLRSLPGPGELLALPGRLLAAVDTTLGLVPRMAELVRQAELILGDTERLIARINRTTDDANLVVARSDALISKTELPLDRMIALLDSLEPSLTKLQPTLERLADTTDPKEIEALVTLIDHLPGLVDQLERDVLPVLTTLGTVAPDLHDLLDVSRELNEILAKIPGLGRIKKRVDEQQAIDAEMR